MRESSGPGRPGVESDGSRLAAPLPERGREVWLFRKTHLDLGFTDQPEVVVDRFVQVHFPTAIATARQLVAAGEPPLVWTSGSWILWQALERSRGEARRALEEGIASGWLAWHALPFTTHSELLDEWLVEVGLGVAEELAARFGRRPVSAKLTDVPGHTVGLVPLLADAGVELLHVGVNPASTVPEVPAIFRWRAAGRELVVMYAPLYGVVQELPGGRAVDVWVTGDNVGPPSLLEERRRRVELTRERPGAVLHPASLDPVAHALRPYWGELPVLDQEIADTWIHGAAADPALLARYRLLLRWRRTRGMGPGREVTTAVNSGGAAESRGVAESRGAGETGGPSSRPSPEAVDAGPGPAVLTAAGRALLRVAEHTFGLDTKAVLGPGEPFEPEAFAAARAAGRYRVLEASWEAKASAVDDAVAALGVTWADVVGVATAGRATLAADGDPVVPGEERVEGPWRIRLNVDGSLDVSLDADDDGLCQLRLGPYVYQRYCSADYDAYLASYVRPEARSEPWVPGDFAKPGLEALGLTFLERPASVSAARAGRPASRSAQGGSPDGRVALVVEAQLTVPTEPEEMLAPPARLDWRCELRVDGSLSFALSRQGKPATRLPEAEWWLWNALAPRGTNLLVEKLGRWIPADRVVRGGGRHLHAVDQAFALDTGAGRCWVVETLESPLVAPGHGRLLRPWSDLPPAGGGASTCLANNVWGTNFRMWNEGSTTHHFVVRRAATPAGDLP